MNTSERNWFESIAFELEVIEAGSCRAFHQIGQKFHIKNYTAPEGLCIESLHNMYPLLYSGRLECDFKNLGSKNSNRLVYKCPSRVVKFNILRFFQCNNCGEKTEKVDLLETKKDYGDFSLDLKVCRNCLRKISENSNE